MTENTNERVYVCWAPGQAWETIIAPVGFAARVEYRDRNGLMTVHDVISRRLDMVDDAFRRRVGMPEAPKAPEAIPAPTDAKSDFVTMAPGEALVVRLRFHADRMEAEGHLNAARHMRNGAAELEDLRAKLDIQTQLLRAAEAELAGAKEELEDAREVAREVAAVVDRWRGGRA
jgi:hypothetical protein